MLQRLAILTMGLQAIIGCSCKPRCYGGKALHEDECSLVTRRVR